MNYCINCKHYKQIYSSALELVDACGAEKLVDPVDGEAIYRKCRAARNSENLCGREGKWFEKKHEA